MAAMDEGMSLLICEKNENEIVGFFDQRNESSPILWGLIVKGPLSLSKSPYTILEEILLESNECEDLAYRTLVKSEELFICKGELFTPKGKVYGQVLLTKGSIQVFINDLAPKSSWNCHLEIK